MLKWLETEDNYVRRSETYYKRYDPCPEAQNKKFLENKENERFVRECQQKQDKRKFDEKVKMSD